MNNQVAKTRPLSCCVKLSKASEENLDAAVRESEGMHVVHNVLDSQRRARYVNAFIQNLQTFVDNKLQTLEILLGPTVHWSSCRYL